MKEAVLEVSEMSCASCAANVEGIAKGFEGVNEAQVNLLSEQLRLVYDETQLNLDQLIQKVTEGGYPAKLPKKRVSLNFRIGGMSCASCVANVESILAELPGMEKVQVNLATEKAVLRFDPDQIKTSQLKEVVAQAGYELLDMAGDNADLEHSNQKERDKQDLRTRFMGTASLTLPLFLLAMGEMVGLRWPDFISPSHSPQTLALLQLALCLPVMYLARKFYTRGLKALVHKAPNMDSLIALGTLASFGYSLWGMQLIWAGQVQMGLHQLYFESTAVILTLILMGKWLEAGSKQKSVEAMKALLKLKAQTARLVENGRTSEIPVHEVMPGDRLLVQIGERIPIDGILVQGETSVDQSFLTGESLPIDKKEGDALVGAALNQGQPFEMEATKTAEDSALNQIIRLVEEANASKAPVARLADRISGVFVPVVMGLALLTGLSWYFIGGDLTFAIQSFVAVMVIACPCALGLATPTAIMVGVGRGASLGILIKGGEALEASVDLTGVVFDKTGTLTKGQPEVAQVVALEGSEEELLALMAGAEERSEHLLAKAILQEASKRHIKPTNLEEINFVKSLGVSAKYHGQDLLVGNYGFLKDQGVSAEEPAAGQAAGEAGQSAIYLALGGKILGLVGIADPIKPEAPAVIAGLKKLGLHPLMLTGDHPRVAQAIAAQLGLEDYAAGLLPADKLEEIKKRQAAGQRLAMVGDGINDAPALMQADLGVAIGRGADVAIESADFILVKEDLKSLLDAFGLSRAVMRKIKQNLFWAFCYNVLGIPFAAGIFVIFGGPALSPMIAALAMALSSVSVLTNSLTLRLYRPA
ncbi:MAG: heavy metal translocating P-type ATPase [bacterium]|nr:heavy metal translocating P-type ATPase [bacterium]